MAIKDKILIALSAVGAFFSAIFYVLFAQSKKEKKQLEKDLEEEKAKEEKIQTVVDIKETGREQNEKADAQIIDVVSGSKSNADVLSELAKNSRERNR